MTYEETAKGIVDRLFCEGCELDCYEGGKCCWVTIKEAIEKQIPKPVKNKMTAWKYCDGWIYTGNCPDCGALLFSDIHPKGCPYCVRAIEWGGKNE